MILPMPHISNVVTPIMSDSINKQDIHDILLCRSPSIHNLFEVLVFATLIATSEAFAEVECLHCFFKTNIDGKPTPFGRYGHLQNDPHQ